MFDAERGGMSKSDLEQMGISPEELEIPGQPAPTEESRESVDYSRGPKRGRVRLGLSKEKATSDESPLHPPGEIELPPSLPPEATFDKMADYKQESGHSVTRPLAPKSDDVPLSPDQIPAMPRGESIHNPTERIAAEREYDLNQLAARIDGASQLFSKLDAEARSRGLNPESFHYRTGPVGRAAENLRKLENEARKLGADELQLQLDTQGQKGNFRLLRMGKRTMIARADYDAYGRPSIYHPLPKPDRESGSDDPNAKLLRALFWQAKRDLDMTIDLLVREKDAGKTPEWEGKLEGYLTNLKLLKDRSGVEHSIQKPITESGAAYPENYPDLNQDDLLRYGGRYLTRLYGDSDLTSLEEKLHQALEMQTRQK